MIKKILVIELAGIGDLVMASPALAGLREKFPKSHIAILSLTRARALLRHCPYIDQLFSFNEDIFSLRYLKKNIKTLIQIRRQNFDIALNLYNLYSWAGVLKMRILFSLLGAKQTLGRNTDGKGKFYDLRVEDSIKWRKHQVEYIMDVVRALGVETANRKLEVWSDAQDQQVARKFLARNSVSPEDLVIGIHPGAARFSRRWPLENFAQLADQLIKRYQAKIVITGGKKEIDLVKQLSSLMGQKPVIATAELSLSEVSALIKKCSLYITNDTGPMHIANALNVPLVAIMGPGPEELGPYQRNKCVVLRKYTGCSPCYKFNCQDLSCLRMISVNDVLHAADKLLA
ncbi:glycosyltransferase family 9 protein [Candidatus Omnitrophota bacterium]